MGNPIGIINALHRNDSVGALRSRTCTQIDGALNKRTGVLSNSIVPPATSIPNRCLISSSYEPALEIIKMNNAGAACSVGRHGFTLCRRPPPFHPAVCRACESPPRTSAAPPLRCAPRSRRRRSRGCRACTACTGCTSPGAAPPRRHAPGSHRCSRGSEAPAHRPHLHARTHLRLLSPKSNKLAPMD